MNRFRAPFGKAVLAIVMSAFAAPVARADLSADFIFRHSTSGSDAIWIMEHLNSTDSSLLSPNPVSDLNWKIVGSGDFNADGHSDIVWWHSSDGDIKLWYMNGASRTSEVSFNPSEVSDTDWQIVGVDDFNEDGKPDLLWQNADSYLIAVWYMNGVNLMATSLTDPSSASGWWIQGTGDFNADGYPDILWQSLSSGDVAIWYMHRHVYIGSTLTDPDNPGTSDWKIVDAALSNGDQFPDILWQHTDGDIAFWRMNGASLNSSALTNPDNPGDANWRVVAPGVITLDDTDSDSDGLPDEWEDRHFGNLNQTGGGDYDGDGLTNLQEFRQQEDPNFYTPVTLTLGRPNTHSRIP